MLLFSKIVLITVGICMIIMIVEAYIRRNTPTEPDSNFLLRAKIHALDRLKREKEMEAFRERLKKHRQKSLHLQNKSK